MPYPSTLSQVYCSDEDIALRDQSDYMNLCPRSQRLAAGSDGVFSGASLWTLSSASVNFQASGLGPGSVLALTRPATTYLIPGGELFAVSAAVSGAITLRRLGLAPGVGLAPSPAGGLTSVGFTCLTYGPQIDIASYDTNKRWGIDPAIPGKQPGLLYDPLELQQFVVLSVLRKCYASAAKAKAEDYALKLGLASQDLDDVVSRLQIQWGAQGQGKPANSIFSTRTRR